MKYVKGDLVKDKEISVFCHQCNCFGKMGAGIAAQISREYPEVAAADKMNFITRGAAGLFGTILPVKCHDGRICVNMYSQFTYGRGKRQTDYDMFKNCLDLLEGFLKDYPDAKVGFPYMIGCGLAGGDWKVVEGMIREFSERVSNDVFIVEFTQNM